MKMEEVLKLINIFAGFEDKLVLRGLSVNIKKGEFVLIKGKNGSGKSTLVKVISGLLKPFSGKIIFNGKEITHLEAWERKEMGIATFLQGGKVFPMLTVEEHFKLLGKNYKELIDRAVQLFPVIGSFLRRKAGSLSGGQRSILALSLAVLSNPNVLVLDEPLAGLDFKNSQKVVEILHTLNEKGLPIIAIEHRKELEEVANKIFVLKSGKVYPIQNKLHKEVVIS